MLTVIPVSRVRTYFHFPDQASDLVCRPRPKLAFAATISHGPGFSEEVRYHLGPDVLGHFLVLWCKSDWVEDPPPGGFLGVAWTSRQELSKPVAKELVLALLVAEKELEAQESPSFEEGLSKPRGMLTPNEVYELVHQVWPELKDASG